MQIIAWLILGGMLGVLGWDLYAGGDIQRLREWLRRRAEVQWLIGPILRRLKRIRERGSR